MSAGVQLSWGTGSDRGLRRAVNEDSFLAAPPVFLVADGMGGHEGGADASRAAIAAFETLAGHDAVEPADVQSAFDAAVAGVDALRGTVGAPGTTLSGVVVTQQGGVTYWLILNIGDSRTYLLRAGLLEQISVDHSAVQALIDRGELQPGAAEAHPQRNVVTRALGAGSVGTPDYWFLPAREGDRLLICSDGLTKELRTERIRLALGEEPSAQAAATRLIHEALLSGGKDNVTVVVVDAFAVVDGDDDETSPGIDEDTTPRGLDPEGSFHAQL